jgi:hypothetical protein
MASRKGAFEVQTEEGFGGAFEGRSGASWEGGGIQAK